ncbi:N-acyl-L-amino_acid_amidohydrolase [Leishmania infantum]|uniref:N-acyl-L-amino_acid_amidohydrolase n=1 Tax=Leishmania infantum TaxID=5671 RepID=A0A6L0WN65_LEIIN|nr:N-acyl-L-amino_acid_amidohydrolase [Leishmania infantum]SUZ40026.1 N-acyl-L-amino_acid_amidohydrolase [Leishmania infantum]
MRVSLLILSSCMSTVPDTITAGGENFAQRVCGRGGHAPTPQVLVDSLLIAAGGGGVVTAPHCVMSRNIDPKVLPALSITTRTTVTSESHNVIPDEVAMRRTVRLCMCEARESAPRMLEYGATGVAAAHGATAQFRLIREYVGTMSDATGAAAARRVLGDDK